MLRMSEITTPSSAPFTQPLSSNEVCFTFPFFGFCFAVIGVLFWPFYVALAVLEITDIHLPLLPSAELSGLNHHPELAS